MRTAHRLTLVGIAIILIGLFAGSAIAYSGFPTYQYPGNQYGFQSRYYSGPWGERMVYGGYGYFPNWYGYQPYGYRTYGSFYTPTDLRMGAYGSYRNAYW